MRYRNILVTGGDGLVGDALKKIIPDAIFITEHDFDLTHESDVMRMYNILRPERVIHLAARVGGIVDNENHPAKYLDDNILMNTLMVKYAYKNNIARFMGILSSCAYPDIATEYPMKENTMHTAPPCPSNFTYAMSKRIIANQIDAYNKEYLTKYNYIIPCNIYGKRENSNIKMNHFIASLIKKVHEAVKNGHKEISLMGDGTNLRQHLYVGDFVRVIKMMIDNDITKSFNIAPPENLSIRTIAEILTKKMNIGIRFDNMAHGQYRKDIDVTLFKSLIPDFEFTPLEIGLLNCYDYYEKNQSCK